MDYSGVSFNEATQLPEAAELVWDSFPIRHPTSKKNNAWLRYMPLGDREVYLSVFWRERATGALVAEAEELSIKPVSQHILDDGSTDDSDSYEEEGCDTDSGFEAEDSESEPFIPTRKRRLTAAQQHRLDTDPDSKHQRVGNLAVTEPPLTVPKGARRAKTFSDRDALGISLETAASTLATASRDASRTALRPLGADDVAKAVTDLEGHF